MSQSVPNLNVHVLTRVDDNLNLMGYLLTKDQHTKKKITFLIFYSKGLIISFHQYEPKMGRKQKY